MKRTAEDIIAIGEDLKAVQERLKQKNNGKNGLFLNWIRIEFGMGTGTAYRFIQVATRFKEKIPNLGNFSASVLYELAEPRTPDEIIARVEANEIPATIPAIREAKREWQQPVSITPSSMSSLALYRPPCKGAPEGGLAQVVEQGAKKYGILGRQADRE